MDHALLGRTGVKVSRLCLGTMSFGNEADEATAAAMYARCRDAGVSFFDCADVYAHGRSEEMLGRLIRDHRDQVVITSKAYFPTGKDVNARGSSRYHLQRAVEASLRRLGTDRIDLFYLHRWDDDADLEDVLYTLELMVQQGKILYPAASNFAAWQAARAVGVAERRGFTPLVCLQPMYNLVKRQAEVEILPMAAGLGLAVCPYSPLGGGLLSGKYGGGCRPEGGRLIANPMYATRYGDASNFEVAEAFCHLAAELGVHPATLAIAWVGSHPAVTAPIIGARNLEQLEPALAAAELRLSPEQRAAISALSPAPPPATDRNEEAGAHNYGAKLSATVPGGERRDG